MVITLKQLPWAKIIVLLIVIAIIAVLRMRRQSLVTVTEPLTWENCTQAVRSKIEESYPARCILPDGRSIIQLINDEERLPSPTLVGSKDYYGSSTNGFCKNATDCVVSGCNAEICQSRHEETLVSICIAPNELTASESGYTCGCEENKCQWAK